MAEKSIFRLPAKRNYNESLNYEDRIIANVVRKKIAALVDEAVKNDVKITSNYFDDKEKALFQEILRLNNLGEVNISAWAYPDGNEVNIPITPTLLNLAATAEELAHLKAYSKEVLDAHDIDDYEGIQRNYRDILIDQELTFAEEVRAKNIADKTVGGYLPKSAKTAAAFRNDYAYSFLETLQEYAPEKIPEMMEKYPDLKNAQDIYDPKAIELRKKIKEKNEAYERWVNKAMPDFMGGGKRYQTKVSTVGEKEGFQAAKFMEGGNSNMTNTEEQLLAHSRRLIYWDESKDGTQKEVDEVGAKYTKGNFHITRERAQDTQFGKNLASEYTTDKAFADYLYDNPKIEEELLREITLDTIRSNPFLKEIDSKTAAAIITSMHNVKTQPNLKKACNTYAKQIKAGAKNLDEFKRACVSQIDVNKGKVPIDKDNPEAGTREVFLPGLALKSLSLQEYALSEDEDADYESITVNVANKYKNTDDVDLKKEVVNKSQIGRVSLQMKNMWDSVPVEKKQPKVEVPVRVLEGVTPPSEKPPEGPEEISGFPAKATFP